MTFRELEYNQEFQIKGKFVKFMKIDDHCALMMDLHLPRTKHKIKSLYCYPVLLYGEQVQATKRSKDLEACFAEEALDYLGDKRSWWYQEVFKSHIRIPGWLVVTLSPSYKCMSVYNDLIVNVDCDTFAAMVGMDPEVEVEIKGV